MYSRRKIQNFPQKLLTQLSSKRKGFSRIFIAFLRCTSSLEHSETKDQPPNLGILEIIDSKRIGYSNVQKALHQNAFQ